MSQPWGLSWSSKEVQGSNVPAEFDDWVKQVYIAKNRRPFLVYLEAYLLKVSCTQHKYDTMILQNRIPSTQIIELIELKDQMEKIAYDCSYLCNRKAELFISVCLNGCASSPRWHLCLNLGSPVTSLTWRNDTMWKVPVLILLHFTIRSVFKVRSTFTLT